MIPGTSIKHRQSRALLWLTAGTRTFGILAVATLLGSGCRSLPNTEDASRCCYVSPGGNDEFPGTIDKPFRTLRRACDVVKPGDCVYLRNGDYAETLTPPVSGEADQPITFAGYRGERVSLIAGRRIRNWMRHQGDVLVADCPVDMGMGLNQLVCNGELMIEARTPNIEGQNEIVHAFGLHRVLRTLSGEDRIRICEGGADLRTEETVLYIGRHGGAWGTQTATGTVDRTGTMDIQRKTHKGYQSWWKAKGEGHLVGAMAYLDHEREWYLDRKTGKLYFIPPRGTDPDAMEVHVRDRTFAIDLGNRKYIVVEGIDTVMGSVLMENSEHCTIRNSTLLYGGHHSFFDNPYTYEAGLASRTGVFVSGRNNLLEHCRIAWNTGASVLLGGQENRVLNCRIHDSGLLGSYYSGIYIVQPAKLQGGGHEIGHNTFYNFGRGAIHISSLGVWAKPGKYASPMRIHHNDISNTMLICDDGGAIYQFCTDGAGSEIHSNWIFSQRGLPIYLDNYSSGWRIHQNVILGEVNVNFPNDNIHVFNNTLLNTRYSVPKYFWSKDNFIANNIDAYYQRGATWDGATCNGVRPTHVRFLAKGRRGLKYRVKGIREGGQPKVKARESTVSADDLPSFKADYFGAYEYGGALPWIHTPWVAGCNWGGAIPEVPRAQHSPLRVQPADYVKSNGFRDNALYITTTEPAAWARYEDIDFSGGYSHVVFDVMIEEEIPGALIELRLDSIKGECIARTSAGYRPENHQFFLQIAKLKSVSGRHDVYLTVHAERQLSIAQLAFVGARATPMYSASPRELVYGGEKIEATEYTKGRRVLLMCDYDFRSPEMWFTGSYEVRGCTPGSWLFFPGVDFGSGHDHLMLNVGAGKHDDPAPRIELRSGSPEGQLLGTLDVREIEEGRWQEQRMELNGVSGVHDVFLVFPRTFQGGLNYVLFRQEKGG